MKGYTLECSINISEAVYIRLEGPKYIYLQMADESFTLQSCMPLIRARETSSTSGTKDQNKIFSHCKTENDCVFLHKVFAINGSPGHRNLLILIRGERPATERRATEKTNANLN